MDAKPRLTPEQYAKVIEGIRVLDQLNGIMDDLEACGERCQHRRQQATEYRQQLEQIANRFKVS